MLDPNNLGIGILHEATAQLHIAPYDVIKGGHDALVALHALAANECKGFAISRKPNGSFEAVNVSHLNGPQGQTGSLQMPLALFKSIEAALSQAGL